MLAQLTDIVNSLSYLGIFLSIFLLPIPQEIILPLAGFMAAQGRLSLIYVVITAVMGSVASVLPWYCVGRYVGEKRLKAWLARHGTWLKLSAKDFEKAKGWFNRYGDKAVLFSQFIIGVRTLIALPAGISRMSLSRFLLYVAFSAAMWQGLLAYAGYLLGNQYGLVNQYLSPIFHKIIIFILFILVIVWLIRRKS